MNKYKVNINRPEMSAEEIVQRKDFNIVLKKYKKEKRSLYKTNWMVTYIVIIAILLIGVLAVRIIRQIQEKEVNPHKKQKNETVQIHENIHTLIK